MKSLEEWGRKANTPRQAESAMTLSSENRAYDGMFVPEFSAHVEKKAGGSCSPLIFHVFSSPSSEEEGRHRPATPRFSPDCWEPVAMSIFSLSQLLW